MRRLVSLLSAAALSVTALVLTPAAPASADTPPWTYVGYAGATQINALGTTISSGMTAPSSLGGTDVPNATQVMVAGVHVGTLANVQAVTTGQTVTSTLLGGLQITSYAEVAKVDLLNGLITADAIQTHSRASATLLGLDGEADTEFVNLRIGGTPVELDLGKNTTIEIPGIAKVVLNESKVEDSPGSVQATGTALHVTLLKARDGAPAGAEVWVNPTFAMLVPTPQTDARPVGGDAYSTYAAAQVGSGIKVLSQPTGKVSVPAGGTNGVLFSSSLASVNLSKIGKIGALTNTAQARTIPGFADVETASKTANVNLLGGLVKVQAIDVKAHVRVADQGVVREGRTNFVKLQVAGQTIPINFSPNTSINVAGIARLWVNQQVMTPQGVAVAGLRIVLSTAQYGLPVGAEIRVAVATAHVG